MVKLSTVATISAGQSAPKNNYFSENGIPFIRAGSLEFLINGKGLDYCEKINETNAKICKLKLYPKNAVLFAKSGMSANKGRVYKLERDSYVVSHLAVVVTDSCKLLPSYFMYWLKINSPRTLIKDESYPSISLSDIGNLDIDCPSIEEQQRIVNILDKAEEIRTKKKLANEKLDEFLKSTFIDMFGDPVTNPKNWSVSIIKEVAEKDKNAIKAGPFGSALKKEYYTDSGYKIYGQEQVISGDINYGDYYIDEKIFNKLRNCEIKENDVLISLVGSYGRILIVPKEFQKGIINPRLMKITFDKSKISTLFFKYFFSNESLQKLLCDNTHGGTMGILNTSIVKALKIIVPPIDLQKQFAQIVQKVEAQKEKNQKVIEQMDNLFNSLMQQAFNSSL